MTVNAKVQGVQALENKLAKLVPKTSKALKLGLWQAALLLQRESQKIVPVDKDILRPSANAITRVENKGSHDYVATVGYGTDYAIYVHENLEARHKPGKSAKFLEKPLRRLANNGTFNIIVSGFVKRALK